MHGLESDSPYNTVTWSGNFSRVARIAYPFLLFLIAFLPRSVYLVARSTVWHQRANRFIRAIAEQDWQATLQAPHPGVTTMWLAGIGRNVGERYVTGWSDLGLVERMAIELIPLVAVISLGIVLAYFLLAQIFDVRIGVVSSLLLALDPFHTYVSKTLHVDALMAVFMMVSALLLWLYIVPAGKGRIRYVALSGGMAGLALLSKTPALFLVSYTVLTLILWQGNEQLRSGRTLKAAVTEWRRWFQPLKKIAFAFAVWLVALVVIYFLLWPSMWVQPIETLRLGFSETFRYADTPHPTRVMFMDQTTIADPGPLFYLVSVLIRTTAVTLPFFLFSITLLFNRKVDRYRKLVILLGIAFIVFFTLQMTLGEKKFDRYLLATFEFVVLLAGVGVVYFSEWIAGGRRWLLNISLLIVVAIQAAIFLPRHPYYGTHFNRLAGGAKTILGRNIVAGQEQGEGLDLAGDFLNNLPESDDLTVGVLIDESFGRYFDGLSVPMIDESVDYLVFARNWIVRETRAYRWEYLWEKYRGREPEFAVSFDGIPYVWVYKVDAVPEKPTFEYEVNAILDGEIRLSGYDLSPTQLQPGEDVRLILYWEAVEKPKGHYKVFTHLLDSDGLLWGQTDHSPLYGDYPTGIWNPGDVVRDPYAITVSPDAHPGDYQIELGMYILETLERLPIVSEDGTVLPESRILIPGPTVLAP